MSALPAYVVLNDQNSPISDILRRQGDTLSFPLSPEDQHAVEMLVAKYDSEENIAGLAAPQIGFSKRIIVFAAPDDPELRKWRKDLSDTMPKTVWINPTYTPIGAEMSTDYEACFSIGDFAGPVERPTTIKYTAYTPKGQFVEGTVTGFLARLIQHEVDHTNGVLFIDKVEEGKLLPLDEYRKMRAKAVAEE